LSEIKVYEVFGLVGNIAAEIPANDAMPGGVVLLVELLLDVCRNVLLNVELVDGLRGAVHRVLLHLVRHVGVLHNCLPVSHSG